MPYYLVTHTSIVKGEDEVRAAQMALAKLRLESAVNFSVKLDEATIHSVTVTEDQVSEPSSAVSADLVATSEETADPSVPAQPQHCEQFSPANKRVSTGSIAVGLGLFVAGLLIGAISG